MLGKVLRIAFGIVSVPIVGFVLFGSVFLFVTRLSPLDLLSFYAVSLVATLFAMTAAGLWARLSLWAGLVLASLLAAVLMIALPLLYWLFVVIPLWLFS